MRRKLEGGKDGWHVGGLAGPRGLTSCRRALLDLGARSVVGLMPRLCLDQDDHSTFEALKRQLTTHNGHA